MPPNPNQHAWRVALEDLLDEDVSLETLDSWLERWDAVEREYTEAYIIAYRDRHLDTTDDAARSWLKTFEGKILPDLKTISTKLKTRFLQFVDQTPNLRQFTFRSLFESDVRALAVVDTKLEGDVQAIGEDLDKRVDAIRVDLDGRSLSPSEVRDVLLRGDRMSREQVWRSSWNQRLANAAESETSYREIFSLRQRTAEQAGFDNYRQYRWREDSDFNPDQAEAFQESILRGVTPVIQKLAAIRQSALSLNTLRPWDWEVGLPDSLTADNEMSGREVVRRLVAGVRRLSPELSNALDSFPEQAFELDRRTNKSNQGFSVYMPIQRHALVFATYRGNTSSLAQLIHELGHATHSTIMAHHAPFVFDYYPSDRNGFNETVAFFFELFTLNILASPECEIVSPSALPALKREKAMRIADRLHELARVELLEHFVYEGNAKHVSPNYIVSRFKELEATFPDGINRSGLEGFDRIRWISHRSLREPFTLGLYCRALVGALAHYDTFRSDPQGALSTFSAALRHSKSLPDHALFGALGLRYPFVEADVKRALDALGTLVSS